MTLLNNYGNGSRMKQVHVSFEYIKYDRAMRWSTLFLKPGFNFAVMCKDREAEITDLVKVASQSSAKLDAHNGQPDPRIGIT